MRTAKLETIKLNKQKLESLWGCYMDIKLQKRHSNILKYIHKLKSENRTLSSRRIVVIDRINKGNFTLSTELSSETYNALRALEQLSEYIERNSLKIMQLRTKISQEKAQFEREELLLQEHWLMNDSQDILDALGTQNEIFLDKGGS